MADRQIVLLIEDNPGDARLIREMLAEGEDVLFELACVGRLSQGLEYLATRSTSLVLLDLSLPDSYGFDTFLKVYAHSPKVPIIVLTGHDDQTVALSAVKTGAQDFLVKGKLDRELLVRSIQYSIERKRYQEQLEYQANYDALTGLPNRNLLNDRLRQSVFAQRFVRSIGVVFLDIDHFKFVNDSLGHNTGDKLLQKVAERLTETVRDGDTVARLGGDEFILILTDQPGQEVIYRAMQRIINKVAEPINVDGQELMVTCSAGISLYPQDGSDVETLLKNADAAMYQAKEKGRNNFQFYTAEMNRQVNERLQTETSLRRALERNEFELYYQPRINVRSGALVGCEALLRWQHPERGMLLPERFIALAEETGLIVPIGEWVLKRACAQARAWQKAGASPIAVSVNLSMRQFKEAGQRARRIGARSASARDGADREPDHARHRRRDPRARAPARNRRGAFGRRLRHRAFEPFLSDQAADQRAQDRSVVRPGGDGMRPGRRRPGRPGDHFARAQPKAQSRGRRRGDRSAIRIPEEARLRRGSGVSLRQADARAGVCGALLVARSPIA